MKRLLACALALSLVVPLPALAQEYARELRLGKSGSRAPAFEIVDVGQSSTLS